MKTLHSLLFAGGLAVTVATLLAQAPAPDKSTDLPGPNAPTPAPVARDAADDPLRFENLDTDGDGRLVLSEFTAPAGKARAAIGNTDRVTGRSGPDSAHADNIVSPADTLEVRYSAEVFRNLDVDHDDALSRAEFETLRSNAHNISQP